jgi:hypothetical protein
MQADSNYIYNKVSKEHNIDIEFVTSVGNFMQKEVANNLRRPEALILKVKGLGAWHLRRVRLEKSFNNLSKVDPSTLKDDDSRESLKEYLQLMKDRLDDYKVYLEEKSKMKRIKDEYYKKSGQNNV